MNKRLDHYETLSNQIVGLIIGYLVTRFISISLAGSYNPDLLAIFVSCIFFIMSYSRTYSFRRLYRFLENKYYPNQSMKSKSERTKMWVCKIRMDFQHMNHRSHEFYIFVDTLEEAMEIAEKEKETRRKQLIYGNSVHLIVEEVPLSIEGNIARAKPLLIELRERRYGVN